MRDVYPIHEPDSMTVEVDDMVAEFPERTINALTSIAVRNSVGYGGAVVLAIANEKFIMDLETQGAKLLIEKGDSIRQLERS